MDDTNTEYSVNPPPMSDREKRLRTKIDVLWDDVLDAAADNAKEIRDLTIRVERLRAELPAAADNLGDKLNVQTGHYLVAAEKLAGVLKGMSEEIDRAAAQAGASASQAAQLDIRQAAAQAAGEAVRKAVGDEVAAVVNQLTDAGRLIRWSFAKVVSVVVGGAVLGGLVAALAMHYLPVGGGNGPQLSEADRLAIKNGQMIQKVWNNLTDKERTRIEQLAGQK